MLVRKQLYNFIQMSHDFSNNSGIDYIIDNKQYWKKPFKYSKKTNIKRNDISLYFDKQPSFLTELHKIHTSCIILCEKITILHVTNFLCLNKSFCFNYKKVFFRYQKNNNTFSVCMFNTVLCSVLEFLFHLWNVF